MKKRLIAILLLTAVLVCASLTAYALLEPRCPNCGTVGNVTGTETFSWGEIITYKCPKWFCWTTWEEYVYYAR